MENNYDNIKRYITILDHSRYRIFFNILILLSLGISISIVVLSYKISYDGELSMSIAYELIDNFNTGYFMSFVKSSLPSNFDSSRQSNDNLIKLGNWQGIAKGCGTINKKARLLDKGKSCENDEIVLDSIPDKDIYSYKGIIISGSTKGSYFELLYNGDIIKEKEECQSKTKKLCGYIDTLNNKLCMDINSTCPISYITISKSPPNVKNLQEIEGENGYKLYFSNNPYPDGEEIPYIVNSFKIADQEICSLPILYYSSIELFILDKYKKEYTTDCLLDEYHQIIPFDKQRYHSIDLVDNYQLYEENNIIEKINNSKLVNYGFNIDNYKDNYLRLYVRTHFGFDKDCLDNRKKKFNLEQLIYINSKAEKMKHYGKNMKYIIFSLIGAILDFFSISEHYLEISLKYLLKFIPTLVLVIYSFSIKAQNLDDAYEEEMTCSDFITNSNYNIMISKIKQNGEKIKIILILLVILLFVNFITFIPFCIKNKINLRSKTIENKDNYVIKNKLINSSNFSE